MAWILIIGGAFILMSFTAETYRHRKRMEGLLIEVNCNLKVLEEIIEHINDKKTHDEEWERLLDGQVRKR